MRFTIRNLRRLYSLYRDPLQQQRRSREALGLLQQLDVSNPNLNALNLLAYQFPTIPSDADLSTLFALTEHPKLDVRERALCALGDSHSEDARVYLRTFIRRMDQNEHWNEICAACAGLGKNGTAEDTTILQELSCAHKKTIRESALFNLQRIRARDGKIDYDQYARRLRAREVADRAVFSFGDEQRFKIRYRGNQYRLAGVSFASADALLDAPLFNDQSLAERWEESRFVSIDGFHPEDWFILFGSQPNAFMK